MTDDTREPQFSTVQNGDLAPEAIAYGQKLRDALKQWLILWNKSEAKSSEVIALAGADYKRVFGCELSTRQVRRLLDRASQRDAGAGDWDRLELYLPSRLRIDDGAATRSRIDWSETTFGIPDMANPKFKQMAWFWGQVFEQFDLLLQSGVPIKALRKRVLMELWRNTKIWNASSWIGNSWGAMRKRFDRRLDDWQNDRDMVDGRHKRKGVSTAKPYDEESLQKLEWRSLNSRNKESQAARELANEGELDPVLTKAMENRSNKSSMPHRLRKVLTPRVESMAPVHQGPRATDKAIPPIDCSYESGFSMKSIQADDFTMPVYFYIPQGDWFKLIRGQVLLCIDVTSLRVLGYCLIPEAQYNSGHIRSLFVRVFKEWGLPHKLYLERGIWKNSKLVTGGVCSWSEVEQGLGQYGVTFIHARRARSKKIERIGGLLQDKMSGIPGYCGRDERRDMPEILDDHKRKVATRKEHPSDLGLLTQEQWDEKLAQLCKTYNQERQDGKQLRGLSPEEVFEAKWNREDPITQFAPEHSFLLALHKKLVTVRHDGLIRFRIRGEEYQYLTDRKYEQLLAWFNPELPKLCTFTDLNMKNPFNLTRREKVDFLEGGEALSRATAEAHATMKSARARYRILKAKFAPTFRRTVATPTTLELGKTVEAGRVLVEEQANFNERARKVYGALGQLVPEDVTLEMVEAMERFRS